MDVERAGHEAGGSRAGGGDGAATEYVSFVVRLTRNDGQVSGVVERVKTGEKERFDGVDGVCRVIARMIGEDCSG